MPRKLLVATTNPGKLREVAAYLEGVRGAELLSLRDLPPVSEVHEDGGTFEANAVKKAIEYSKAFGGLTVADDSGICVDALGGEPGVDSAYYGGPTLDDDGRNRHLLKNMEAVEDPHRTGRFVCVLALADAGSLIATFEGKVEGRILREPEGENGFGYDPLFYYEPLGRGFGTLTREEKAAVSHRGRALGKLAAYLTAHPELFG